MDGIIFVNFFGTLLRVAEDLGGTISPKLGIIYLNVVAHIIVNFAQSSSFLPLDEAVAPRVVFVILSGRAGGNAFGAS